MSDNRVYDLGGLTRKPDAPIDTNFVSLFRVYNLKSGAYETVTDPVKGYRVGVWTSRAAAERFATTQDHVVVLTPYARKSVAAGRVRISS